MGLAVALASAVALGGTGPATISAQPPAASKENKVAAVVNGVEISSADLEAAVKMGGPLPGNLTELQRRQRYMEALGMLIDGVLMQQFLEKHTPPVAPTDVAQRIADLEKGLKEQGKSLAEFCHDTNRTLDQLKAGIAEFIRWSAYTSKHVSDAVVEQYYKDNKDVFDKVSVKASHIVLRVPSNANEAEKAKAKAKLKEIREKLEKDPRADFAEMAKKYSQDPLGSKGGDLGWFPRKWVFDESFSKAAFSLQVGQVSDVVQTDFGYHLIKVTDRKAGEKSDFAKIKEAVREFCTEDLRQQILAEQRKTAKITMGGK
jgi:parvulin-like peptidyl-prolyl isomerase